MSSIQNSTYRLLQKPCPGQVQALLPVRDFLYSYALADPRWGTGARAPPPKAIMLPLPQDVQKYKIAFSFRGLRPLTPCLWLPQDHGRRSRGDASPTILEGDANANCPPIFCHIAKFRAPKGGVNSFYQELTRPHSVVLVLSCITDWPRPTCV